MSQDAEETDKGKAELVRELDISGFTLDIVLTYVCELGTTTSSTATLIHTAFTIVINDTGAKIVRSLKC